VIRYRYPRLSDPRLEAFVLGLASLGSVVSAALAPPLWRYLLIALALVLAVGTTVQVRRRYRTAPSWMATQHAEATARDAQAGVREVGRLA
jgi:hypothetical protein